MAWSESEITCRKHPKENPQPWVCPSCLRERLSEIAGNYSRLTIANNYYYYSSNSPSISGSPVYNNYCYSNSASSPAESSRFRRRGHQRIASDVMDSIYLAIRGNISNGLKKSRSMANFASRNINDGARDNGAGVNRKKKGGFWNKLLLLRSTGKKSKF